VIGLHSAVPAPTRDCQSRRKHIVDNDREGSQLHDLCEVLPSFPRRQVQNLLQEMKSEKRVRLTGKTGGGRWHKATEQTFPIE
jgi:hypothetical protein